MTFTAVLHQFARSQPNVEALVTHDRNLTWAQLVDLIGRTASHLSALDIRRGDRVGLSLGDTPDYLVALLALAQIGAVAVPLDWRAPPAETAGLVAGLGLACTLTDDWGRAVEGCAAHAIDDDWRAAVARTEPTHQSHAGWADPFAISATSGSTGQPKLTVMSHAQYDFAIQGMWELMGLAGRHRFLSNLPLYYSGGRNSGMAHLLRGDCVIFHPSVFSAQEYVEVVVTLGVTAAAIVPSMARQLIAAGADRPLLPGLAAMFCSGAPLHAEEKRQAVRLITPHFHERYGAAETLAISVLRPSDFAERPDSVGRPHSRAVVEIVDEFDHPQAAGVSGRLRMRAPGMGEPLPGNAAEANFHDGWFYPGEIAHLDSEGYIFLEGRVSDVIMRSGAKIHPAEVEAVLAQHPGVADAVVLGRMGDDNEESVIAFVVARGSLQVEELLGHCRARLSPHKTPQDFRLVAALPRNTGGKVDRAALAKLLNPDSRETSA